MRTLIPAEDFNSPGQELLRPAAICTSWRPCPFNRAIKRGRRHRSLSRVYALGKLISPDRYLTASRGQLPRDPDSRPISGHHSLGSALSGPACLPGRFGEGRGLQFRLSKGEQLKTIRIALVARFNLCNDSGAFVCKNRSHREVGSSGAARILKNVPIRLSAHPSNRWKAHHRLLDEAVGRKGSRRIHSSERVPQKIELSFRNLADSCLLLVDRELQLAVRQDQP
jgi:hypothetical protein